MNVTNINNIKPSYNSTLKVYVFKGITGVGLKGNLNSIFVDLYYNNCTLFSCKCIFFLLPYIKFFHDSEIQFIDHKFAF